MSHLEHLNHQPGLKGKGIYEGFRWGFTTSFLAPFYQDMTDQAQNSDYRTNFSYF